MSLPSNRTSDGYPWCVFVNSDKHTWRMTWYLFLEYLPSLWVPVPQSQSAWMPGMWESGKGSGLAWQSFLRVFLWLFETPLLTRWSKKKCFFIVDQCAMSTMAFFNILGTWSWTCPLLTLKDMKPNSQPIMICVWFSVTMTGLPQRSMVKCWTAVGNTWLSKHTQTCWFKPNASHATSWSSTTRKMRKSICI